MKRFKQRPRRQSGWTLLELLVVIAILGVLYYLSSDAFRGSSDSANQVAIDGSSKNLAKAIGFIHLEMGTGLDAMNNPMVGASQTMMDVLMVGEDAVSATGTYKARYRQLNMRPLEGDFRVVTRGGNGTAGVYQVLDFGVSFVACPVGTVGKVCVQYTRVPTETLTILAQKSGISDFAAGTARNTGSVRYTAAASGLHTVTLERVP